jgi:hypothetical protein
MGTVAKSHDCEVLGKNRKAASEGGTGDWLLRALSRECYNP